MGGLAIKLDMFQSLALAVIAIWLGNWCRQKFPFLRKYLPAGCCRRRHNYFPDFPGAL